MKRSWGWEELTRQILRGGRSIVETKEDLPSVALSFRGDVPRLPRDGLLGADRPVVARPGGRDFRCDDDERAAFRDGGRGRRRSGEGEGRKECGEELHRRGRYEREGRMEWDEMGKGRPIEKWEVASLVYLWGGDNRPHGFATLG